MIKTGSRVVAISNFDGLAIQGKKGIVVRLHPGEQARVCWDDWIKGHTCSRKCVPDGHGWIVDPSYLKEIPWEPQVFNDSDKSTYEKEQAELVQEALAKKKKDLEHEMSHLPFQIGDKVLCTAKCDGNYKVKGQKGIVAHWDGMNFGVKFDINIDGHKLNGKDNCPDGHGWYIKGSLLKKVK